MLRQENSILKNYMTEPKRFIAKISGFTRRCEDIGNRKIWTQEVIIKDVRLKGNDYILAKEMTIDNVGSVKKMSSKLKNGNYIVFDAVVSGHWTRRYNKIDRELGLESVFNVATYNDSMIVEEDIPQTIMNLYDYNGSVERVAAIVGYHTDRVKRIMVQSRPLTKKSEELFQRIKELFEQMFSIKEIAEMLNISTNTVRTYRPIKSIPMVF